MIYADAVLPVMRGVREILMPQWGRVQPTRNKTDRAVSPVTEADVAVEVFASAKLREAFPDISFVGEESGGSRGERFWLMDPIDGTDEFIRGLRGCTSMLALIERGAVMFSVIYDFLDDTLYWAERGCGAFRNNERIHISSTTSLAKATVYWEMNLERGVTREILHRLEAVTTPLKAGTAGADFIAVARGERDARICIEGFGYAHDFAAGSLLVEEAGGVVRNIGRDSYSYENTNFYAGNPILADAIMGLIHTS